MVKSPINNYTCFARKNCAYYIACMLYNGSGSAEVQPLKKFSNFKKYYLKFIIKKSLICGPQISAKTLKKKISAV